ncbi:MAG: DNA-directed RNA polymerase subunit alpha C-terminal domain-containing protein [Limnochordia bacterium]|nr:DNA-directed RNA polymerase subunit alpha C-terminal domain-containing protein [Limnochordia bacterium]
MDQLLSLEKEQLRLLPGAGDKTVNELMEFQESALGYCGPCDAGEDFTDSDEPIPPSLLQNLTTRAYNVLGGNNIRTVGQLLSLSREDLYSFRGSGVKTVKELMTLQMLILEGCKRNSMRLDECMQSSGYGLRATPRNGPLPLVLLNCLSTSTRNVLRNNDITTIEQLLGLDEAALRNAKVVAELKQFRHLLETYKTALVLFYADGPEAWSILGKTLSIVRQVSDQRALRTQRICDLGLDDADLQALKTIAVFPHDVLDDLCCLSLEIIVGCGISERGFSTLVSKIEGPLPTVDPSYLLDQISDDAIIPVSDVEGLPDCRLEVLDVSEELMALLSSIPIRRLYDVLYISERSIIESSGFSLRSLKQIVGLWSLRLYLRKVQHRGIYNAYTSFEMLWKTFLESVCSDSRDADIVEGRMGVLQCRSWTLEELGEKHGVSRERIRQIEKKLMTKARHPRVSAVFEPLWKAMHLILPKAGGVLTSDEVAEALCAVFDWSSLPADEYLVSICEMKNTFLVEEILGRKIISLTSDSCKGCSTIEHSLHQLLDKVPEGLRVCEAAAELRKVCDACSVCDVSISEGYVWWQASKSNEVMIVEDRLYNRHIWAIRFGSITEGVTEVLQAADRPMHFNDLVNVITRYQPEITARNIYACVADRVEEALLWDKGTYIHRQHVSIPFDLIYNIEDELVQRLRQEDGPSILSVNGIFIKYETELKRKQIPTDRALYSCLKVSDDPDLSYPRYPYVMLRKNRDKRPTVFSVAEQFVGEHEDGVTLERIEDYLVSVVGISQQLVPNYCYEIPNVIQIDTGLFMHVDHLGIDPSGFGPLLVYLDELLHEFNQLSIDRVFNDKMTTCKRVGVTTPIMLYSILRVYYEHLYELPRYPVVARLDTTEEIGVQASIERYVREKNGPCSLDELFDYFVETLGFKQSSVYNLRNDSVLSYVPGVVIHIDILEWKQEKQQLIEKMALAYWDEQRLLDKPYGLVSDLLESRQLPVIPDVPWTSTLLGELLCSDGHFKIVGSARNAFFPLQNEDGIHDLQSLIYVLLNDLYGGAVELGELEALLCDNGIILKRLTPSMLGDESLVCIENNVVRLTEFRRG